MTDAPLPTNYTVTMNSKQKIENDEQSFLKQNKIKIAATLAAVFIWFLVVAGDSYDYTTEIPVEILIPSENYIITSPVPTHAKILIEGSGKFLISFMLFKEGALRLTPDLEIGAQTIRPTEKDVFLFGSAQNLSLRRLLGPDSLRIEIDKLQTLDLPIHSNVILKPSAGYTIVGKPKFTPDKIQVRGPHSVVGRMDSVHTSKIVFDELKFPFEKRISLIPPSQEHVEWLTTELVLTADVQKLMEKTITDVPVTVRYLPQDLDAYVIPQQLSLTLQGGVNIVYALTAKDIQAFLEYPGEMDTLKTEFFVKIDPIEGVRFQDIKPEKFKIVWQRLAQE